MAISDMEVRDVSIVVLLTKEWVASYLEVLHRDPDINPPVEAHEVPQLVEDEMLCQALRALDRDGVNVSMGTSNVLGWMAEYTRTRGPLNNRDRVAVEAAFRETLSVCLHGSDPTVRRITATEAQAMLDAATEREAKLSGTSSPYTVMMDDDPRAVLAAHAPELAREVVALAGELQAAKTARDNLAKAGQKYLDAYHDRFDAETDPRVTPAERLAYDEKYEETSSKLEALVTAMAPKGP